MLCNPANQYLNDEIIDKLGSKKIMFKIENIEKFINTDQSGKGIHQSESYVEQNL